MHSQLPTDLGTIAATMQWFVTYSINRFLPETVLTIGFLLAILFDLVLSKRSYKHVTAYFAVVVLAAAGVLSALEWSGFDAAHAASWKGGDLIFPYTQTLFAPHVTKGATGAVVQANYSMAAVDNFAVFFKLLISLAGIFVVFMSLASRELNLRARHFGEYYSLILGMTLGLYLMPAATDLLMMYLAIELVSIASYVLAGFSKESIRGSEAALKYVLFGAFSSALMLYGFSYFYGLTGSTNVIAIRQILSMKMAHLSAGNQLMLWFASILALAGMSYKISAVPFHFWTPDIYEGAPTPVTALLSVASKAAGFGLLLRFVLFVYPMVPSTGIPLINWPLLFAVLATATMTLGNLAALLQSNVKRMLAYSSIAHAGYMLVGVVVAGTQVSSIGQGRGLGDTGIVAVLIYLATYLFMNLGAFYVVMLVENRIGSEEIDDYRGLVSRTPLASTMLAIFLVSLTGIPLTAGFIGKFYLFTAALQPDPVSHDVRWLWLVIVAIANSIVSLYYYLRVVGAMFLKRPLREGTLGSATAARLSDAPLVYSIPVKVLLFALVIPVIGLGIYFQPLVDLASGVIRFFNFDVF